MYRVNINLTLGIHDVKPDELEDYINGFFVGLSDMLASDDPDDDHYELLKGTVSSIEEDF